MDENIGELIPDLYSKLRPYDDFDRNLLFKFSTSGELTGIRSIYRVLKKIPEEIYEISTLEELEFSNIVDNELHEELTNLSNLRRLTFSNSRIDTIPEFITELPQLQYLNLTSNKMASIPNYVTDIPHLEELILDNNNISTIPKSILNLTKLKKLSLNGNKIDETPAEIGKLPKLSELYLSNNNLKELPQSLLENDRITHLDLSNNKFQHLSYNFFSKMNDLSAIKLNYDYFAENDFKKLQALRQSSNQKIDIIYDRPYIFNSLILSGNPLHRQTLGNLLGNYVLDYSVDVGVFMVVSKRFHYSLDSKLNSSDIYEYKFQILYALNPGSDVDEYGYFRKGGGYSGASKIILLIDLENPQYEHIARLYVDRIFGDFQSVPKFMFLGMGKTTQENHKKLDKLVSSLLKSHDFGYTDTKLMDPTHPDGSIPLNFLHMDVDRIIRNSIPDNRTPS